MSNTEESSGIGKSRGNAQAGGGPAADPTPSAGLDVQTEFVLLTGVAIIRATLGCAQLLFIQRWDSKLELPKGQMQAGETEEQAAERIALQEAGVGGIQLQTAALGELQCKDKPVKEDKKVVTVIKETIRVLLASPSEQFVIESRENVTHVWISLDDLPKLIAGTFVGASRLHAMYIQDIQKKPKKNVVELALNHFAVAVPFLLKAGGGGERGEVAAKAGAAAGDGTVSAGSFIRFIAALDFEATCFDESESGPGAREKQDAEAEIIEFPTVLYRVHGNLLEEVGQYQRYVRPVKNPILSAFCTKMTGISQHQVDASDTIEVVLQDHTRWLAEQTCNARNDEILFVTDGDADLGEFLKIAEHNTPGLSVNAVYGRWSNIKVEFCKKYKKATTTAQKKLQAMMQTAGLTWHGNLHSGLDDSVNVGRLLKHLWEEKDLRVFTSFTESQFRKRRLGGGGGGGGEGGAGRAGTGGEEGGAVREGRECGSRGLKFGSLNILNHDAFIKWTEDYGLDVAEVRASREWRFENVVRAMQDMDCDVWGVQEVALNAPILAERLGYALLSQAHNSSDKSSGVCILLRQELMCRVVGQPLQRDSRYAPVAGVTLELGAEKGGSATITLLTTHLKMNYPNVSVGLTELGAAIDELGLDVSSSVVMGDLNVDTPQAQQDLMKRGQLSRSLASFSVGLEATPLLPDNLLIGCSVPRFAIGVCAYVPTLLLHAKGCAYKEEFNRSIMSHRAAVSDHYPIMFKIDGVKPSNGVNLKLRGLPFTAVVSDIVHFFNGFNVAPSDVQILMTNGRASGDAIVCFGSEIVAQDAQSQLHRKMIGTRYIEISRA